MMTDHWDRKLNGGINTYHCARYNNEDNPELSWGWTVETAAMVDKAYKAFWAKRDVPPPPVPKNYIIMTTDEIARFMGDCQDTRGDRKIPKFLLDIITNQ